MPESSSFGFGQYVPGFDFLQTLAESAAKGMPRATPAGMPDWSGWVAPTLQPEELDKRIKELKTVQFWLEQNARALAATIQALEVQKMSLATLRSMNVQMGDLASAFRFPAADGAAATPAPPAAATPAPRAAGAPGPYDDMFTAGTGTGAHKAHAAAAAEPAPEPADPPASAPQADADRSSDTLQAATGAPAAAGVADPLQWWNALTEQFQQIAASALQDAARQPPVMAAAAPLADAARQAFDAATRMASGVAAAAGATSAAAPKAPSPSTRTPKASTPRKATARAPKAPAPSPRGTAAPTARSVARPPAPSASSAAPRSARRTPPPAAAPTAPRPTRKR